MDYAKHYDMLITRARTRVIEGYVEMHHVLPRCMGGGNEPANLVPLTAEEHYVAHLLLVKIHPTNHKLIYAANMMLNRNNKSYGWVRRKFSEAIKIQNKGQQPTDEQRRKLSVAGKGKRKSDEWKTKIGLSHTKTMEYKGDTYLGFDELKAKTGVSYHLYNKYYLNGVDPEPYIGNPSHGMVNSAKTKPNRSALGRKWYHNNQEEHLYFIGDAPEGWQLGRLPGRQDGNKNPMWGKKHLNYKPKSKKDTE